MAVPPGIIVPTIASMSNTPQAPEPRIYGAAHVGDVDDRYESFVPMFQATQLDDVIVGTPTITITRPDGVTVGLADMQIVPGPTGIIVDPTTHQTVYWWFQNCMTPNVVYQIDITVKTKNGRTLTRSGYIGVKPELG